MDDKTAGIHGNKSSGAMSTEVSLMFHLRDSVWIFSASQKGLEGESSVLFSTPVIKCGVSSQQLSPSLLKTRKRFPGKRLRDVRV